MPVKQVFRCLLLMGALRADAQAPPAVPVAPKTPASVIAGIPVNYDEAKVGTYALPDALTLANGKPVRDAKTWTTKRRPEIVKLFATEQYGVAPGRPADESFDVFDNGTPVFGGKAMRKQVVIHLSKDPSWPAIQIVEYLPVGAKGPVPMFLSISFSPLQMDVDDSGVKPEAAWVEKTNARVMPPAPVAGRGGFGRIPVEKFLDAGFGVATFYYGDVDPDYLTGFSNGIRAKYMKAGQTGEDDRAGDAWGSIAAWAWGMSRVEDYFETDKDVDAKRVTIHGVSRLGKTVMWAGANDQRFAAVIASCSGEGGAALSRRDSGETIAHLMAPTRYPYQFAANYAKWGGFPDKAPMDANMLVALIAPRPLLLQTGSTDNWSDPKGEFLAAVAAGPVYKLLGKQDLGTDVWPAAKTPIFSNGLNYYMHEGGHGMVAMDWDIYVQFLKMHFQ
jgi:(4-O-methyl)-D-glucuronate---lignin esterase